MFKKIVSKLIDTRSPEQRYLEGATSLEDLERRQKEIMTGKFTRSWKYYL